MQFLLKPIIKNGLFLFYLLLSITAFVFIFRQKAYQKAALDRASTQFGGYVDQRISGVTNFISLKEDNLKLSGENAELRKEVEMLKAVRDEHTLLSDSVPNLEFHQTYTFIPAQIVNNSVIKEHNMLTINRGTRQGVKKGMGVISTDGVVGYIYKVSDNYARVLSTLNTQTRITAQIKGSDYFGTIRWNGKDPRYVQFSDIPKYVNVSVGDTIETDGKSGVIPGGIMIGVVKESETDEVSGELDIEVELKEDFGRLRYAQVVMNLEQKELDEVENTDSPGEYAQP